MKMVWSPEIASRAYLETVNLCGLKIESNASEMLSAMAAGWNSRLIVEARSRNNGAIQKSIGLAIAAKHTGGRHMILVPDENSNQGYIAAMQNSGVPPPEVVVGEAVDTIVALNGIDFLVVDGRQQEAERVFREAKLSQEGAVLVFQDESSTLKRNEFKWDGLIDQSSFCVAKSMALPVGDGLVNIAHVANDNGSFRKLQRGPHRWIRHIDQKSGEEHIFRA